MDRLFSVEEETEETEEAEDRLKYLSMIRMLIRSSDSSVSSNSSVSFLQAFNCGLTPSQAPIAATIGATSISIAIVIGMNPLR